MVCLSYSLKNKSWTYCLRESSKALHCMTTGFNICHPLTYTCKKIQNQLTLGASHPRYDPYQTLKLLFKMLPIAHNCHNQLAH